MANITVHNSDIYFNKRRIPKYRNYKCAGGIIYNKKLDKVLIVLGKNKIWSLPKGHKEPNENSVQTAKREIYEETGINVTIYPSQLYRRYNNNIYYIISINRSKTKIIDNTEIESARWVTKPELSRLANKNRQLSTFSDEWETLLYNR
jgi:8-oxo-dGTP pyrophosphatase MutT (NUDIX family)